MSEPIQRLHLATLRGVRHHVLISKRNRPLIGRVSRKKMCRAIMGWLRPIRCPRCRQYTKQVKATASLRRCLCCHAEFTRGISRMASKLRGVTLRRWLRVVLDE